MRAQFRRDLINLLKRKLGNLKLFVTHLDETRLAVAGPRLSAIRDQEGDVSTPTLARRPLYGSAMIFMKPLTIQLPPI